MGWLRTYRDGVGKVLDKKNALELDQEEIDQLLHVLQHALDGVLGNGVVFTRTGVGGDSAGEDGASGDLHGSGD